MRAIEIVAIVGGAAVAAWFLFDDQIWRLRHKFLEARARKKIGQIEQAVLVHLRANDLPEEVYQKFDVSTLQDQLREAIARGRLGEFTTNAKEGDPIAFFATAGARLAVYPRGRLAEDIGPHIRPAKGFGGITIAHNVRRKEEVAEVLGQAERVSKKQVAGQKKVY